MARKANPTLSDEEINNKRNDFENKMNSLISDVSQKKTPIVKFLEKIDKELQRGVDNGVSYVKLSSLIKETYDMSISSQAISKYIKDKKNKEESEGGNNTSNT